MIRASESGGVGVLTLDRPDSRNALTPAMLAEMAAAIGDLTGRARVLVLEGEGKAFCAGFDLSLCRERPDGSAMRELLSGLDGVVRALRDFPGPTVMAAHRAAIAGACALVAAADFAVADRGARLGYPVVLLGISPAVSGPTLAPAVGSGAARGLMLDPGLIRGDEARRLGLVSDLVENEDEVRGAAGRLAASLAAKPRGAVGATKAWLNRLDGAGAAGRAGLEASLELAGGDEERALLERFWASRG